MKIIIALGLLCGIAMAQTTPNLNFNIPAQGTPNWGPLINANFSALDSMLSGLTALPKLNTTNGYQVGGVTAIDSARNGFLVNLTVSGTCTGCGAVTSVFGRTGAVVSATNDYAFNQISGIASVAQGGTGTASPGLIQGTNITITGTWPNQTINSSASGGVSSVGATSPVLSSGGSTPTISISGVTALQGNGSKLQIATGTTTTGHYPSYDASGNLVDSTQPAGTHSAGTTNDVQIAGAGGTFAADTGVFFYTPSTHILNAGQGITTTSTGVATTLGLSGGTTPGSLPINSFGWLGPNNATFTSYFFQCPTTPPTNGQTIVFGTQVGSVVPCTYATSSSAFSAITSGTNSGAAMVVGTGASLAASGSGTIAATSAAALASTPAQCTSGQFATGVAASGNANCSTPAGGSGGVAFQLLVAVCQLTAGKSLNGSFPAANAPTPDCISGNAAAPQSGRALFSQISLAATPNQWVDQQFILPNPLTGTYSLVVKVQNDVVTAGTDYVSFQYVCVGDGAGALPAYSSVQSFSVAVPTGTANTYATITGTPTIIGCSAGNTLYTRLGVVSGSLSPTTNNLAIHSATLFVK